MALAASSPLSKVADAFTERSVISSSITGSESSVDSTVTTATTLSDASLELSTATVLYFGCGVCVSLTAVVLNVCVGVALLLYGRTVFATAGGRLLLMMTLSDTGTALISAGMLVSQYAMAPSAEQAGASPTCDRSRHSLSMDAHKSMCLQPLSCILPFYLLLSCVMASALSTLAIAIDRFATLAWPLNYNDITARRHVHRFFIVAVLAFLALSCVPVIEFVWPGMMLSSSPCYSHFENTADSKSPRYCRFSMLSRQLLIVLAAVVFVPVASTVSVCCVYVYCVARSHIRAIVSVEMSVARRTVANTSPGHRRCFHALLMAIVFVACWSPLCVTLLVQPAWIYDNPCSAAGTTVRHWLQLMALSHTAINPMVNGCNNAELRRCVQKLRLILLERLGLRPKCTDSSSALGGAVGACGSNARIYSASAGCMAMKSVVAQQVTATLTQHVYYAPPHQPPVNSQSVILQQLKSVVVIGSFTAGFSGQNGRRATNDSVVSV